MSAIAAPAAPSPGDGSEPSRQADRSKKRIPALHDEVLYLGKPSTITRVIQPGSPDSRVDVMTYHGLVPEISQGVAHNASTGWCWREEAPPPEPTVGELLAKARLQGVRVPSVGEPILYLAQKPAGYGRIELYGVRARIAAPLTPNLADIEIFVLPDPPEDSRQPDRSYERKRVSRGMSASCWCFPDELTDATRFRRSEVVVVDECPRCHEKADRKTMRSISLAGDTKLKIHSGQVVSLCENCWTEFVTAVGLVKPQS